MAKHAHYFMVNGDKAIHLHSENDTPYKLDVSDSGALTVTNEETGEKIPIGSGGGSSSGTGLPEGGEPNTMLVTDGEGNAKWEARTHWKEEGRIEILPEISLEVDGAEGEEIGGATTEPVARMPESGKTYLVSWNGTEYACVAEEISANGLTLMALGNTSLYGGTLETEDPFVIAVIPPEYVELIGATVSVVVLDGSTEVTLAIGYEGVTYHKLDPGYLPIPMTVGTVDILPETTFEGEGGEFFTAEPLTEMPVVGKSYTVTWNGASYECVVGEIDLTNGEVYFPAVGDLAVMETGEPTGAYPFVIFFVPSEYVSAMGDVTAGAIAIDGSTEVVIKVCSAGGVKIDNSALDMDWIPKKGDVGATIISTRPVIGTNLTIPDIADQLEKGKKVVAYLDGKRYECIVSSFTEGDVTAFWVGNPGLTNLGGDLPHSSEPFCVLSLMGETHVYMDSDTGYDDVHKFSLYEDGKTQKGDETIPSEFLPAGLGAFRVTVSGYDNDTYTVDAGCADIYEAFMSGRHVYCYCESLNHSPIMQARNISKNSCEFYVMYEDRQWVMRISGQNVDSATATLSQVSYGNVTLG